MISVSRPTIWIWDLHLQALIITLCFALPRFNDRLVGNRPTKLSLHFATTTSSSTSTIDIPSRILSAEVNIHILRIFHWHDIAGLEGGGLLIELFEFLGSLLRLPFFSLMWLFYFFRVENNSILLTFWFLWRMLQYINTTNVSYK